MSVLAQAFFTLVRRHFVAFVFLSVRHCEYCLNDLFHFLFHILHKSLGGLESGNVVGRDDNGGVLADVTASLLGTFLHDEAAKTTQVDVLALGKALFDDSHKLLNGGLDGDFLDTGFLSYFSYDFCLCHFSVFLIVITCFSTQIGLQN